MATSVIDAGEVQKKVVDFLDLRGFKPRDSDGSDYARPGTPTRFKVGTSRGEVAITVWNRDKQVDAVRITSEGSLNVAMAYLAVATQ